MRTFRGVAGKALVWTRVGRRKDREFELRAGDELVATLAFDSRRSDHARARSGDGAWRFERTGVVRTEIRVTAEPESEVGPAPGAGPESAADPESEAVLQPARLFRPGSVEIRGRRYAWRREGLLSRWRSLADDTGPLVRVRPEGLGVTGRGRLEIRAAAFARSELPLLALVAWYLAARRQGKEDGG